MPTPKPLADKRILMFVDDIYEDLELWYPKYRLQEAGAQVIVAGPEADRKYAGKNGYGAYVSAYYLSRWGNDEARDNNGTVIPNC